MLPERSQSPIDQAENHVEGYLKKKVKQTACKIEKSVDKFPDADFYFDVKNLGEYLGMLMGKAKRGDKDV